MTKRIKALFKFIEFLHSNIQEFNQYERTINNWVYLADQMNKLPPSKTNFKYDLKLNDLKGKSERDLKIIQKHIREPIHSKATDLNICDVNNENTIWIWNNTEINTLKDNFREEHLNEILKYKKRYVDFRTNTNVNEFLMTFFSALDTTLYDLFDYFSEPDQNQLKSLTEPIDEFKPEQVPEHGAELYEKIKKHFGFFNRNCPRQHKQILNSEDFKKLIGWTTFFYENQFELPKITNPIKIINTNKTFVQLAFRYLFKELHKSSPYPQNLFDFYQKVFSKYSLDKRKNFEAVKNNDEVKKLMEIEY